MQQGGLVLSYCNGCPAISGAQMCIPTGVEDLPDDLSINDVINLSPGSVWSPIWLSMKFLSSDTLDTTVPPPPGTNCTMDSDCLSSGGNQWLYASCGSSGHCQCGYIMTELP